MKKNASNETASVSLQQTFWRWFSFSVLALALAAAWPARSADVFIDEGDGDFAATPVSSAPAQPGVKPGPAPASEDSPIANPGSELDAQIGQLEPASPSMENPAADPMAISAEVKPIEAAVETPVEKSKKTAAIAKKKKEKKAASKKSSKKKSVAKNGKSKSKNKEKKTAASKKSKKKSASASAGTSKRKVASVGKFAGGKYATTSKECAMESQPGAGDTVGTSKASRKLWVEESGNTSYWKVYGKSGAAAYLSRDCF